MFSSFRENNKEKVVSFTLSSFLRSPRSELDLLRKLADVLIVNLCPRSYVDCFLLRHALRELLACQGIDKLHRKVIELLVAHCYPRRSASAEHRFFVRP